MKNLLNYFPLNSHLQVLTRNRSRLAETLDALYVLEICKGADVVTADQSSAIMAMPIHDSPQLVEHVLAAVVKNGILAYRRFLCVLKTVWRYSSLVQVMMEDHQRALVSHVCFPFRDAEQQDLVLPCLIDRLYN